MFEIDNDSLLPKAQKGDKAAFSELVNGNMGLVKSIALRFRERGVDFEDLVQIGTIGLIKAIRNFDTSVGTRFSTYAVPMIIGEIRRYLRDNNAIRISRSMRDTAYKALQAREEFMRDKQCEPTVEQIAAMIGEKCENVVRAMEAIVDPVSLYEPVYNENGDSIYLMDQLSDTNSSDEVWLESIALKEAMKKLSEREQTIIKMRFFGNKTQMEIASEIGISQAQVSRLEKGALSRMRKQI